MKTIALFTIASAMLLVGCSSGPYVSKTEQNPGVLATENVLLIDKDLRRTLTVDPASVNSTRDGNGRLQIMANLRNRTNDETIYLQVQTLYYDKVGRVLYSNAGNSVAWENIVLTPNQSYAYSQTALTPEAATYRIQIRYTINRKIED